MARVRTLLQLREEVRQRADMEESTFVTDAEVNRYINEAIAELYEIIVESASQEYYLKTYTFTTEALQDTYLLPADLLAIRGVDADIGGSVPLPLRPYNFDDRHQNRWLPGLWGRFTDIRYRMLGFAIDDPDPGPPLTIHPGPLLSEVSGILADSFQGPNAEEMSQFYVGQRVGFYDGTTGAFIIELTVVDVRPDLAIGPPFTNRVIMSAPLGASGVSNGDNAHAIVHGEYVPRIRFTPEPTTATSITVWYIPHAPELSTDTDRWNGFNGWEEYAIVDAAIRCLEKEESDTSALEIRKQRLTQRLRNMAPARDIGMGGTVQDVTSRKWVW